MSVMKVRDADGSVREVVVIKGDPGKDGKDGGISHEDYATKDKGGTVRVNSYYGIANTSRGDGVIWIYAANNDEIDARAQFFKPIVPANLEYAVRSVGDGCYASIDTIGDIEAAVDAILAIQEKLIGGGA